MASATLHATVRNRSACGRSSGTLAPTDADVNCEDCRAAQRADAAAALALAGAGIQLVTGPVR